MKLIPAIGFLFICFLAIQFAPDAGVTDRGSHDDVPSVLKGRLIVKYKDTLQACVHCLLKKRARFSSVTSDGTHSLDELHSRFEVSKATPVFRTELEEQQIVRSTELSAAPLKLYHHQKLQNAKLKFPPRSRRIPRDATLPDLHHIYVLQFPQHIDVAQAAKEFARSRHVEYAHPDYLERIDMLPNDDFYRSSGSWGQPYDDLWGLKKDKMNMEPAWDLTQGEGIVVGVVDTGVDYTHPDIASNIWKNPEEIAGNGKDDDRNGFVDDKKGWNFVTCQFYIPSGCYNPNTPNNDPFDDNLHGTHVSGSIAAVGNNRLGIIGVAPRANILPVKSFNSQGIAPTSVTTAGVLYAAENGADVINNSWGCGFCPNVAVRRDMIRATEALGVVVVFSAGNIDLNVRIRSPQNLHDPKPIVVAASDPRDQPTFFSTFGATVDVTAPGGGKRYNESNILSLKTKDCTQCTTDPDVKRLLVSNEYLRLQGTSMSAPHVAGLAALMLALRPNLTTNEVRHAMRASADDIERKGLDPYGTGRINAFRALQIISTPIVKILSPQHLSVTNSNVVNIRATVTGSDLSHYQLSYSTDDGNHWTAMNSPVHANAVNKEVGRFNIGALPLGWKTIKVEAVTRGGLKFQDLIEVGTQLKAKNLRSQIKGGSRFPNISKNLIVWSGDTTKDTSKIYVHNIEKNKTYKIADVEDAYPYVKVDGKVILWKGKNFSYYYCVFDESTGNCPAVQFTPSAASAEVSGERIVYRQGNGLRVYNIQTKEHRPLIDGVSPDISGDKIVFQRLLHGSWQIFLYDLKTNAEQRITNNAFSDDFPRINGNYITYSRRYDQNGRRKGVILYDITTRKEKLLPIQFFGDRSDYFSGNRVVWTSVADVYVHDLKSGTTQAVKITPIQPRGEPVASDRHIVWWDEMDFELATGEIYMATLPE